jgi:hypothetical protein
MTEARYAELMRRRNEAADNGHLAATILLDSELEDLGMHGDDRRTCHSCQSWADHKHEKLSGRRIPDRLVGAIMGPQASGNSATLPSHNHNSSGRVPGCPLCDVLNELERERPPIVGSESMYPTPEVDPQLDVPDGSLDANEWAARFVSADSRFELDEDAVAAWFAAALRAGQQNPTGSIEQL